eukprot:CAMPEP_0176227842 /NCGR_PEP_ID=MMETSP0121_2-20121125/22969_1 /TAXON_ID=160619 /ORGANISM="Kryptoperidinium foliaceum, Strain CCMP 1326" /LENGTH=382 /DNA_ID=CAMNT_0017567121 /DNA_START=427 /DNA_END=1572 /DNA_ORIENTATION=+
MLARSSFGCCTLHVQPVLTTPVQLVGARNLYVLCCTERPGSLRAARLATPAALPRNTRGAGRVEVVAGGAVPPPRRPRCPGAVAAVPAHGAALPADLGGLGVEAAPPHEVRLRVVPDVGPPRRAGALGGGANEALRRSPDLVGLAPGATPTPAEALGQRRGEAVRRFGDAGDAPRRGRVHGAPLLQGRLRFEGRPPLAEEEVQHARRRRGVQELLHILERLVARDEAVGRLALSLRDRRAPMPPPREELRRVTDADLPPGGHRVVLPVVAVGGGVERLHYDAHPLRPQRDGRALEAIQAAVVEREPVRRGRFFSAEIPLAPPDDLNGIEGGVQDHVVVPAPGFCLDLADRALQVQAVLKHRPDMLLCESHSQGADNLVLIEW